MKIRKGFTIIEVIMFLAISSLVMVVVLSGIAINLNRARYKDSVNSYIDFLKGQYNSTVNVINNRSKDSPCLGGAIVEDNVHSSPRGTSECTVVGQLIQTDDGRKIKYSAVYSTVDKSSLDSSADDLVALKSAGLISSPNVDEYEVAWGASIKTDKTSGGSSAPMRYSILIVRTPTTGIIHTYVLTEAGKKPSQILESGSSEKDFVMCVDSAGLVASPNVGVTLRADSINSSGVVYNSEVSC